MQLPLDIGYYESDSAPLAAQNSINLYPNNPATKGALSTGALFRTPGILNIKNIGVGPGRGFHKFQKTGTLFSVSGNELYKQTNIANATLEGVITGTGRVSMSDNGVTVVIIVPGGDGYFYTIATSTLTKITDPIFADFQLQQGGVTSVTLKDSQFVYTTNEEFFTGSLATVNNGQDFDALDFEDAEVNSDPIVRTMTIKNELYMFGTETIELYQNVAGSAFPFQRILGATIDKGIASRFGIVQFDNSFVFLGNGQFERPAIWRGQSGMAQKISTTAIDNAIQNYTAAELASVFAWAYMQDGSTFAGFTFPNETFVYDATASSLQQRPVWHQRQSGGGQWRVSDITSVFGEVIVSDLSDGRLGLLGREYEHEYTATIVRECTGMYMINNTASFRVSSVELSTTSGIGDINAASKTIELQYSSNGGQSFNSAGNRNIGVVPEYNKRQIWRRLGRMPYSVVFRFTTTDLGLSDLQRLDAEIVGQ